MRLMVTKHLNKIKRYGIDFVAFKYPDITKIWALTVNKTETKQKLKTKFPKRRQKVAHLLGPNFPL